MSQYRVQSTAFDSESTAETLLEGLMEGTTIGLDELEIDATSIRSELLEVVEVNQDDE